MERFNVKCLSKKLIIHVQVNTKQFIASIVSPPSITIMTNITGDRNLTSKLVQEVLPSSAGVDEFFSALNIFLSITASLGNVLILVALHKVSSIHPATKRFFQSLAVTDLCVGLVVQPLFVIFLLSRITEVNEDVLCYMYDVSRASSWILCAVSVLTSTAISVDRLLALLLGLRYRHVVTLRRVRVVIICFWLIGTVAGSTRMWRRDIALTKGSVVIILSLVTSIFSYTKIHLKLRLQQVQVQNNVSQEPSSNSGEMPLNIARYKKTVSSILWVQLALVACYISWGVLALLFVIGIENGEAWIAAETLIYLNSSLNPILYCWKIREVRQVVKDIIKQLNCICQQCV